VDVEAVWNKRRILEVYLNVAEWGDGVFGAQAAARHYSGWTPPPCRPRQAAQMAAMLPAPGLFDHHRDAPFPAPAHRLGPARLRRADPVTCAGLVQSGIAAADAHCRPRERSPEIVAYTAPLRDPSCQPARNARRSKIPSMKNFSDIGVPGFDPIQPRWRSCCTGSRSSHRGGVCDRPADVRRTGIARAGALDQLQQVIGVTNPGSFGAEAAVAVFAPPRRRCRIDAALAAQCHELGARGDVLFFFIVPLGLGDSSALGFPPFTWG